MEVDTLFFIFAPPAGGREAHLSSISPGAEVREVGAFTAHASTQARVALPPRAAGATAEQREKGTRYGGGTEGAPPLGSSAA